MEPSVLELFGYILGNWKIDRASEESKSCENTLAEMGFSIQTKDPIPGRTVEVRGIAYTNIVADVLLCDDTREGRVVTRERSFPYRTRSSEVEESLPDPAGIDWNWEFKNRF